ncbi:MAG: hypothetical protein R3F62_23915 [Planctomycetota bacterium]
MQPNVMIGAMLILAGLSEIPLGLFLSTRIPPHKRVAVFVALAASGLFTIGLGAAFIAGAIPLGG